MENASKALIMAASVLLGVMILSIGVYLFYTYSSYSADAYQRMEDNQIAEFNAQFLKYYGNTNRTYVDDRGNIQEVEGPILCTIHNIMSLANLAAQNNVQYGFIGEDDQPGYDENTYYIQIDIANKHGNLKSFINCITNCHYFYFIMTIKYNYYKQILINNIFVLMQLLAMQQKESVI